MRIEYIVVGFIVFLIVLLVGLTILGNAADLFRAAGELLGR